MKKLFLLLVILNSISGYSINKNPQGNNETKIQVAILLDTSSSMDGLIDQAKSRLWNIVNTLTTLKYKGETPAIEIALYEYGNDGLSKSSNYIRQVTPLTTDLDLISEKLFSLKTNGGLEYCGAVIEESVKKLNWGNKESDMKLIYIAGNESFNQGEISYVEAINEAVKENIYINTIHCGSYDQGVNGLWKDGADKGQGKYFNIDSNKKVRYIETPYDVRIKESNERLNNTYIGYGKLGADKKSNQRVQDTNASTISSANYAERIVSKSKNAYRNDSWDLVDRYNQDEKALSTIKKEDLPVELQSKTAKELKEMIEQKNTEREQIKKEIEELAKERKEYIAKEMNKSGEVEKDDLGKAINTSILTFAKIKGYSEE